MFLNDQNCILELKGKINNDYSPQWRWLGVKVANDNEVNNCFSIY